MDGRTDGWMDGWMDESVCVCVYVRVCVHVCVCMCRCTYTHTHIPTYTDNIPRCVYMHLRMHRHRSHIDTAQKITDKQAWVYIYIYIRHIDTFDVSFVLSCYCSLKFVHVYLSAYIPNHTNMEISKTKNTSVHIYLYRFTNRPSLYGCIVSLREGGKLPSFRSFFLSPKPFEASVAQGLFWSLASEILSPHPPGASCRHLSCASTENTSSTDRYYRCKFQETEPGLSVYSPVCLLVPVATAIQAEGQSLPLKYMKAHIHLRRQCLLISKFWHGCRSGHDRRCMRRFNSLFRTGNTKAASSSLAGNPADGDHAKFS